jgi:hypothetical protein
MGRLAHVGRSYAAVARGPAYVPLWLSQLVSSFGDTLHYIALVVLVYELTGRGAAVALLVAAEVVPVVLLGPVAGVVIDRFSRKAVLIRADLARALLALSLVWPQGAWHAYLVAADLAAKDQPVSDFEMDLHLTEETLVVVSRTHAAEHPTAVADAISTADGKVLWSHRLGTVGPYITVTDDAVAIPHQVWQDDIEKVADDLTRPGFYVSFYDLETGAPIFLYGPSGSGVGTVSASGDVVCINEGTAITCVDTASDTRSLVQVPYAPAEGSYAPLLYWKDTAIILDVDDGVRLIQP